MKKFLKTIIRNSSIALFLLLIYIPAGLYFLNQYKYKDKKFDVELLGFTDEVPTPVLNVENVKSGQFQSDFTAWTDSNLPLRGVYIKTYNTINFYAFKVCNGSDATGGRYLGSDGYVFEQNYLYSQLSIGPWDYSDPARVEATQNMVSHMESIDQKLQQIDKRLYVYVVPGKADLYSDYIPQKFVMMGNPDQKRSVDYFREALDKTEVPHRFFSDMAAEMEYPTYYQTGIHWSRPFEQKANQTVIADIIDLTDGNFRNFELMDIETSKTPYFRDNDLYDLFNVWTYPDIDYYQYTSKGQEGDFEPLRILIMGDSFTIGLTKDVSENLPEDTINFISRADYWTDTYGNYQVISGDYNNLDMQFLLDISDVVVIEMVDVEVARNGYGFCEYLDSFLDTYEPRPVWQLYPQSYDVTVSQNAYFTTGFNGPAPDFTWTKREMSIMLHSDLSEGLEVSYGVPVELLMAVPEDTVSIYVNDVLVSEKTYAETIDNDTIIIPGDLIEPTENDIYEVRVVSSGWFVPKELGINEDVRELALKMMYIGRIR
ncbi:MAG: hypothetical protein MJ093_06385 [Saccharofermentans sp.]|nr:hypothetical protein [Saccharofermentans sp.]